MAKTTSGSGRTRNFATIVYPESCPENWLEILGEHCIPAFVSPLHDCDFNPTDEKKKDHYHVMLMFDGVKTLEQAKEITDSIGGVGCQKINSVRGYARYLCHLDNPEKAQYNVELVRCFGGADYVTTIGLVTDKYKAIGEMMDYCVENGIYSYSELLMIARHENQGWFRVLCDNGTIVIKEFLKSLQWTLDKNKKDSNTAWAMSKSKNDDDVIDV